MSPSLVELAAGIVVVAVLGALVYWDTQRVGFERPRLWIVFVLATVGGGALLFLLVPSAPRPGIAVLVFLGVLFYMFERYETEQGTVEADPRTLPNQPPPEQSDTSDDER